VVVVAIVKVVVLGVAAGGKVLLWEASPVLRYNPVNVRLEVK